MNVTFVDISDLNDVGQRIDNFLIRHLKGVPKQKIYSILRKGEVRVNSSRVKQTYRLELADRIRIPPIMSRVETPVQMDAETRQTLEDSILFEDNDFIAINKPFGFAVHGGSTISAGVVEMLRVMRNQPRIELAHRLDRDTSGCLLLCKKRGVLKEVQAAFRNRLVKKKYSLIVSGKWPANVRTVQHRLLRYMTDWGERRVRVDANGQVARTDFHVVETTPVASMVQASLHTGRTHQIRVHAQHQGHAILGDTKYGRSNGEARKQNQGPNKNATVVAQRLCLHASRLVIPVGGDRLDLSAPVESSMADIWRDIRSRARE